MQFRNLGRFQTGGTGSNMQLSIPVPKTPDGRVYRYSPNENAEPRHFVLGNPVAEFQPSEAARQRMKIEPRTKQTVCPYSGVIAAADEFAHPEDIKAAREIVQHAAAKDVEAELSRMFEGFNSRQSRNSFIRLTAKVENTYRPKPRFSRRDLMRDMVCDHCSRDYGVFAIGLFCPDCGAPNLRLHFAREIALVDEQIALAEGLGEAQEELAYRLLGNAHEDVLTAFEATLKTIYLYGMAQRPEGAEPFKPVKNDFQNIERGKARFGELGLDPFGELASDELDILGLNIQKRHVIGHNLGIMDAQFARLAEDAKIGETVTLVGTDIRTFGAISQKVIDHLDAWLAGSVSPFIGSNPILLPPMPSKTEAAPDDETAQLQKLEVNLSPLARRIGLWLAKENTDGTKRIIGGDDIRAAFPDSSEEQVGEGIAELKLEGYIETKSLLSGLPYVSATVDLFATFDPIAVQADPAADSLIVIEKILSMPDAGAVPALHQQFDWPHRRFNPALMLVLALFDSRRVSRQLDSTYPAMHFIMTAEDRVSLKRHLDKFRR